MCVAYMASNRTRTGLSFNRNTVMRWPLGMEYVKCLFNVMISEVHDEECKKNKFPPYCGAAWKVRDQQLRAKASFLLSDEPVFLISAIGRVVLTC